MAKKKLTLSVDEKLVEKARENDLNISDFLESQLASKFGLKKEVRWMRG